MIKINNREIEVAISSRKIAAFVKACRRWNVRYSSVSDYQASHIVFYRISPPHGDFLYVWLVGVDYGIALP